MVLKGTSEKDLVDWYYSGDATSSSEHHPKKLQSALRTPDWESSPLTRQSGLAFTHDRA